MHRVVGEVRFVSDDVPVDGRTARRERNRERVVEAYIELLGEGVPSPSAEALAERADVTARTVYRYLNDDVPLKREVAARIVSTFRFLEAIPDWRGAPLTDRTEAYVTLGLDVYRRTAPIMRVARANFATGPVLAEALLELRALIRSELSLLFEPELRHLDPVDQQAEVTAIHALILFDSLEYLHEHLDAEGVRTALCRHLMAVLESLELRTIGAADAGR